MAAAPEESVEHKEHVVILGYGRVGQSISRLLKMEDIDYVALDADPFESVRVVKRESRFIMDMRSRKICCEVLV